MPNPNENMDPEGEDLLPLSALNDLLYCERRCWLHRVAGLDADNAYTLLGSFEHERADEPSIENRPGVRIERALPVLSRTLGLIGRADVVEFLQSPTASASTPYPVDYKHGPKRKWDNDDVQLCAQAMCLEEMLNVAVPAGAIFHVQSKRRREVLFTAELRDLVRRSAVRLHDVMRSKEPPTATLRPQCEGCSMHGHCLPEAGEAGQRVHDQIDRLFLP